MRKALVIAVVITLLAALGLTFVLLPNQSNDVSMFDTAKNQTQEETPQEVKASFAIFTNGTFRVFTASMYHNLSEEVFIESSNPNIVRVKNSGITWDDFFKTLPFKLSYSCLTTGTGETFCTNGAQTLKFYINGELAPNALSQTINQDDKLLVSFGNESEQEIKNQIQQIPNTD